MSIQIIEKSGEGLSRVYGVTIPAADLEEKLDSRIRELTPQMNIKGFRPGKVPVAHVRRLHGRAIMAELVQETLSESAQKVITDSAVRPAGEPEMKAEGDLDQVIEGKADLAYEISFEIIPDFTLTDLEAISLKRQVYDPTEAEVDEAVAELASQNKTYAPRTGKSVKAKDGDMVVMDFVGRVDGEAFEGGTADGIELVLGSGQFIPGFEEQLKGVKPGDELTVSVNFPDDYGAENLKGKAADFAVKVHEVKAPQESKPDDALAERLGVENLEKLRELIRANLESQYASATRFKLKRALLDALDASHEFPLPPKMVEAEFESIWKQVEADKESGGDAAEDADKPEEQLRAEYRRIAERRVRLGLVLAEIGRTNEVAVTDQEMTEAMRQEALRYGAQAQQIFELFRSRPELQAQMRAPIFEDKVVDLVLAKAKVEDAKISKEELLKEDDLPEGYGG